MEDYELILLIITLAVAITALVVFIDLCQEVRCLRFAMKFMEEDIEKLKVNLELLEMNND